MLDVDHYNKVDYSRLKILLGAKVLCFCKIKSSSFVTCKQYLLWWNAKGQNSSSRPITSIWLFRNTSVSWLSLRLYLMCQYLLISENGQELTNENELLEQYFCSIVTLCILVMFSNLECHIIKILISFVVTVSFPYVKYTVKNRLKELALNSSIFSNTSDILISQWRLPRFQQ